MTSFLPIEGDRGDASVNAARPRRLYLHIGQTKAGSTSLQNWLEARHDSLLEQGFLFPLSVFGRENAVDPRRSSGHLSLLHRLREGDLGAFEAELAAAPDADLILSAENLFLDQPDAMLSQLGTYFQDWDITLVLVLRPQLDWLRSRYIENVMSGFHCATYRLPDLAQDALAKGWLDYPAQLAHVQALIGAKQVRALAYDAGEGEAGLVPRILAAMGVEDAADADHIRDNQRSRDLELLEAKRRLNALTGSLELQERLRLEQALRRTACSTRLREADHAAGMASARTGLDRNWLLRLQAGNDALLEAGVLDHALGTGQPDAACDAPICPERVEDLFAAGLDLATGLAWQAEDFSRFADSPLGLTEAERDALLAALRRHPVSLHVDSVAGALLAAQESNALAGLLLSSQPTPWKTLARLDQIVSASPLLALPVPADLQAGPPDDIIKLLEAHHFPPPGLIVAGRGADMAMVVELAEHYPATEVIILDSRPERIEALPLQNWLGQKVGNDMVILQQDNPDRAVQ